LKELEEEIGFQTQMFSESRILASFVLPNGIRRIWDRLLLVIAKQKAVGRATGLFKG
jgi:hypothetical protein